MFDETLASRVARLQEAEQYARDRMMADTSHSLKEAARESYGIRKLALLKIEQALLIAGF